MVQQQRDDSRVVNVAGGQRMLSQKMAKEALVIAAAGGSDSKTVSDFSETTDRFSKALKGLAVGDASLGLPPATNPAVLTALREVEKTWKDLEPTVAAIKSARPGTPVSAPAGRLLADSDALLAKSIAVVDLIEADHTRKIARMLWILGLFGVMGGVVAIASWLIIRSVMVSPLVALSASMQRIAGGDLTVRPLDIKSNDEIGAIARAYIALLSGLRTLIADVHQSVGQVRTAADELSQTSGQAATGSQEVARAVGDVAGGASQQAQSVGDVREVIRNLQQAIDKIEAGSHHTAGEVESASRLLNQMVASLDAVSTSAHGVADGSRRAADKARNGAQVVDSAVSGMLRVRNAVHESAVRIQGLEAVSDQISGITEVLQELSEQTNLLALNAAIEAARAGEHGRGFAVVAGEVRRLAERSGKSAREIDSLITNIQVATSEAVKAMNTGTAEVETGSKLAEDAGQVLQEILAVSQQAATEVNVIATSVQQLRADAQQVVRAFHSVAVVTDENSVATAEMAEQSGKMARAAEVVAEISQQNAAASEEVAASMEEMGASAEEVAASAHSLALVASDLQTTVSHFRL
jgi:methyl-accepting chemotaxis protein